MMFSPYWRMDVARQTIMLGLKRAFRLSGPLSRIPTRFYTDESAVKRLPGRRQIRQRSNVSPCWSSRGAARATHDFLAIQFGKDGDENARVHATFSSQLLELSEKSNEFPEGVMDVALIGCEAMT